MATPRITPDLIAFHTREARRQRDAALRAALRALWRALTHRRSALAPQRAAAAAR